jgi:hypothetical protein
MALEQKSVEGLIDYIAARQTDFRQKISGASVAQIEQLNVAIKQFAGFDLPEDYRQFLATMGATETPFSLTYDATHVIGEVLEKHQILLEDGERLPPNSFLIAVYGFQTDEIALECFAETDGKIRSGRVFVPDGERVGEVLGDGFIEYLYGQAFKYVVGAKMPVTGTLIGNRREPNLAQIENVAAHFGLEKQWFSDSITFCACDAAEKTVVYARQKFGDYVWLRVSGEDRKTIAALKESLMHEADLNFEKWWD